MARVEITITRYHKLCPYCKKKPLIKATCGDFACQFKHHILHMRKNNRKTDQIRPTARIKI